MFWYAPSISENSVAKIVPPFVGRLFAVTDRFAVPPELKMSLMPGFDPSHNWYAVTPEPALHANVALVPVSFAPGAGVVRTPLAGVPDAMKVYAFDLYTPLICE